MAIAVAHEGMTYFDDDAMPLQGMPGRWNTRWGEWIDANPNASALDVYQFTGSLMDEFGLSRFPIHPYRK